MLKEFSKLAGNLLVLHGHISNPETARDLARMDARIPSRKPRGGKRMRDMRAPQMPVDLRRIDCG